MITDEINSSWLFTLQIVSRLVLALTISLNICSSVTLRIHTVGVFVLLNHFCGSRYGHYIQEVAVWPLTPHRQASLCVLIWSGLKAQCRHGSRDRGWTCEAQVFLNIDFKLVVLWPPPHVSLRTWLDTWLLLVDELSCSTYVDLNTLFHLRDWGGDVEDNTSKNVCWFQRLKMFRCSYFTVQSSAQSKLCS